VAENGITSAVFHPGLSPDLFKGLELRIARGGRKTKIGAV